ncbi:uncharacterized protein Nmag_3467 [Natrialba magadii ATCC 43099]|uniref:Uncharacterized protein n=2 Tax=Natrialba magadii (strain ATCC 43099 / DSM 3394 / CCM 3739 / CIP 104546 / IAM 13178 / JCM 8861 / NBRC 102185 / NCIMB 2190 / MS3) TaxID=547559 RepID=D3STF0_NATMM|nr:uncharacterized protein Nmag_3467 [Natrialba magadii ATCC 43099]
MVYMSRTIKVVLALVVIAVLWKLLSTSGSDIDDEIEYDPVE